MARGQLICERGTASDKSQRNRAARTIISQFLIEKVNGGIRLAIAKHAGSWELEVGDRRLCPISFFFKRAAAAGRDSTRRQGYQIHRRKWNSWLPATTSSWHILCGQEMAFFKLDHPQLFSWLPASIAKLMSQRAVRKKVSVKPLYCCVAAVDWSLN